MKARIAVRDVTLRDGLQDEVTVPTSTKVALFDALIAAGVTDLEIGSFVRPDRVPAMADAEALCHATASTTASRWGLVLNTRGAQRAIDAGLRHLQYVVSVSETHSLHNAGATPADAMAALTAVLETARTADAAVELTLATAFGCPFEGPVDAGAVLAWAEQGADAGVAGLSFADTVGVAVPTEVAAVVSRARSIGRPIGVHLHDTRGLGLANALAAMEAGADRIDGSVGGLGGCPFAPGASGNLPLEDLVHALDAMGVETGVDVDGLVRAATEACAAVGRPVASHVGVAGPRFR